MNEVMLAKSPDSLGGLKQEHLERQAVLIARISAGVDRDAVEQSYDAFKYQKKDDILPLEGMFYRLGFYQDMSTEDASEAQAELRDMNQGLIGNVLRKFNGSVDRMEDEDLRQEAWLALSVGAWTYDEQKASRMAFTTYAHKLMFNRLFSNIAEHDYPVALPVEILGLTNRLRRDRAGDLQAALRSENDMYRLVGSLGREVTSRAIRGVMSIESQWRHVRALDESHGRNTDYFDNEGKPTKRQIRGDISDQLMTNAHEEMEEEVLHEVVLAEISSEALGLLSERDRFVLEYRFGMIDGEPKTLQEVGDMLGCSRERIRQIEARAISSIRSKVRLASSKVAGDLVSRINPKQINPRNDISKRYAEGGKVTADYNQEYTLKLQSRYHAWGDYCEEAKLGDIVLLLALADKMPDKSEIATSFSGLHHAFTPSGMVKVGSIPEIRQAEVQKYMTRFVSEAKAVIAQKRKELDEAGLSYYGNINTRAYAELAILAKELRKDHPEEFQKAMDAKYTFPN